MKLWNALMAMGVVSVSIGACYDGTGPEESVAEAKSPTTAINYVRCEENPALSGQVVYTDQTDGVCLVDEETGGGWNLVMRVDPDDPDFDWSSPLWKSHITKGGLGVALNLPGSLGLKLPFANRGDGTGDLDEILMVSDGGAMRVEIADAAGRWSFLNFTNVFENSTKGGEFGATFGFGSPADFAGLLGVVLPPLQEPIDSRSGVEAKTPYWELGGAEIGSLVGAWYSPWDHWASVSLGVGLQGWPYAGMVDRTQSAGPGDTGNMVFIPKFVTIYVRNSRLIPLLPKGAPCKRPEQCESNACSRTLGVCMDECPRADGSGSLKDVGDCTCFRHHVLESVKHAICDDPYSGEEIECTEEDWCDELEWKRQRLLMCIPSRRKIIDECFRGAGDWGHENAIITVKEKVVACEELIETCEDDDNDDPILH